MFDTVKKVLKANAMQFLYVILAFVLLVAVCFASASGVVRSQLLANGRESLEANAMALENMLLDYEVSLTSARLLVEQMAHEGATNDEMVRQLVRWSDVLRQRDGGPRNLTLNGVYGVVRSSFIDGNMWSQPNNYNPTARPWFSAGLAAEAGETVYTDPYMDLNSNALVLSMCQKLTDDEGGFLGVLAMDVNADGFTDFVKHMWVPGKGHGVLLDADFEVMVHTHSDWLGLSARELPGGEGMADILVRRGEVAGYRLESFDGHDSMAFFTRLNNGWWLGTVSPVRDFYATTWYMGAVLSALGLLLMTILLVMLLRLGSAKLKSEEENRSKSTFLAKVSHEIRTPMNAIVGMSELILREEDLPPSAVESALVIKQASGNLLAIINDILDFSKMESGMAEITLDEYQPASLLQDVVSIIRTRFSEKPVQFYVQARSSIPAILEGDELRVRQVLVNLLNNAAKYTTTGQVTLTARCNRMAGAMMELVFEVADTGAGIKKEDLPVLFGEFVQLDLPANRGLEGTGLGLAITRSLCVAMGGDITVESEFGKGSVFTVTLPQRVVSAVNMASLNDTDNTRVLLFEDDRSFAGHITATLDDLGASYSLAGNTWRFSEMLAKNQYSHVFVSAGLYSAAAEALRRQAPDLPVMVYGEFSQAMQPKNGQFAALPLYSLPVAAILNGNQGPGALAEGFDGFAAFMAPEARVLLVDDMYTNLVVAKGLMAPYGMDVDVAQSGQQAVEMAQSTRYDVIFMDHMMPGMDGVEAAQAIWRNAGGTDKAPPIVALTANAMTGAQQMFLDQGFAGFLAKPIETGKLNQMLEKVIPQVKRSRNATPGMKRLGSEWAVEGVDTDLGIAQTGGTHEGYLQVLRIFMQDGDEKMQQITACYLAHNLADYAAHMHALKSALGSIGAMGLSGEAAALEQAARGKRTAYLQQNTEPFFGGLRRLLVELVPLLAKTGDDNEPSAETHRLLQQNLSLLREGVESLDVRKIDRAMKFLNGTVWPTDIAQSLGEVNRELTYGNYGETARRIGLLQSELEKPTA